MRLLWKMLPMSSIAEIESAIEKLSVQQLGELADWLQTLRLNRAKTLPIENWLEHARGSARPNQTPRM
jgi:hypothetical protein